MHLCLTSLRVVKSSLRTSSNFGFSRTDCDFAINIPTYVAAPANNHVFVYRLSLRQAGSSWGIFILYSLTYVVGRLEITCTE